MVNLVHRLAPDKYQRLLTNARKKYAPDAVRRDRRDPNVWLVQSATNPHAWWKVRPGTFCGCQAYKFHGMCSHLVLIDALTTVDCPACSGCGTVHSQSGGWKCDACTGSGRVPQSYVS